MPQRGLLSQFTSISTQTDVGLKKDTPMIVGVSANLLSRRAASPDLGRRAIGVWAFAASLSKDLQQETKASTSSARTGVGSSDYGALL